VFSNRFKMRAARDKRHIRAVSRQLRAEISANRAGADNRKSHTPLKHGNTEKHQCKNATNTFRATSVLPCFRGVLP
jgi:hypothetical protein